VTVSKAYAVSLLGLNGTIIEIEAEISSNLPSFVLVGLPDASLTEAKDRVRAAAHNSGLALPGRRVTVNLSPASVPKRGAIFDLAIAMAIMAADGKVDSTSIANFVHLGELGLDGSIRPVAGVLPAVLAAKRAGRNRVIVPVQNLAEAQLVEGIIALGASKLVQVARFHGAKVNAPELYSEPSEVLMSPEVPGEVPDLSDVVGQDAAVEALAIAATGAHHMLLVGPPGAGKTMIAERLASILPPLSNEESIETSALRSIVGVGSALRNHGLTRVRPFESPHHSASLVALIGGGATFPRPGLVSLAHNGVIFLDEAPEFQRQFLEALRQPLESGEVLVHRSSGIARFPARFQLVMAANPCPCGNFAGKGRACVCAPSARMAYLAKLSGPLLDRIDVRLKLQPASSTQVTLAHLGAKQIGRSSAEILQLVVAARERSAQRLAQTPWSVNAQVPGSFLRRHLKIDHVVAAPLNLALERGALSMRGYDRCLRLAWSSADLAGRGRVSAEDIAKAINLRGGDGVTSW
jgi:magnesium chelatase family protein